MLEISQSVNTNYDEFNFMQMECSLIGSSGRTNATLLKARNSQYTPRVTLIKNNAETVIMNTDRNIRLGKI